jgi:hypothetical protein
MCRIVFIDLFGLSIVCARHQKCFLYVCISCPKLSINSDISFRSFKCGVSLGQLLRLRLICPSEFVIKLYKCLQFLVKVKQPIQ